MILPRAGVAIILLWLALLARNVRALNSVWQWECRNGSCVKTEIVPGAESRAVSLAACRLLCTEAAALWPRPTGEVRVGAQLVKVNVNSIDVLGPGADSPIAELIAGARRAFQGAAEGLVPAAGRGAGGRSLVVDLAVADETVRRLALDTDEHYNLTVAVGGDGRVHARVTAATFFGARHGLETLGQLLVYDDLRDELQMPESATVVDAPAYPYRGVLLDTSRNFVSVAAIKRTLVAMGASKLNRFHWHITDTQSFPYAAPSQPELAKYGAYSPQKVYTPKDVAELVQFALERGVAIVPEFDAPAHVGEGWQNTGFLTCFNKQPWAQYCVEPPCGQFDPTKDGLYDVLEDIYGDMLQQFQPDIFHMGGDEVHFGCWNSTDHIVEWMATNRSWGRGEGDFVRLWDLFQARALARMHKKAGSEIPVVMWTSTLTQRPHAQQYLPKDKYIIQVWTLGHDRQVAHLLEDGYRLILSNYDALYFDCGFAGWVQGGNNWCSPYIGWQKVYENKPVKIAGNKKNLVLGSEATLWTEQADSSSVDNRLWPRAAAMAETLWTEPQTGWREAEQRFLVHRERLVARGVSADTIEPEWCMHYEHSCPISK